MGASERVSTHFVAGCCCSERCWIVALQFAIKKPLVRNVSQYALLDHGAVAHNSRVLNHDLVGQSVDDTQCVDITTPLLHDSFHIYTSRWTVMIMVGAFHRLIWGGFGQLDT